MKYLKSMQPVPGKGVALTYYEISDGDKVKRMMTVIPQTGEITRYPKPVIKTLFEPERLQEAPETEFLEYWDKQ